MLRVLTRSLFTARLSTSCSSRMSETMRSRIDDLVKKEKVVVFMKGTRDEPQCGFSRNVKLVSDDRVRGVLIEVLEHHGVPFRDCNVLAEPELRDAIKEYSDWPTIPQVFVDGQFIGGCDILVQMHKDGEITAFFDDHGIPSKYSDQKH